LRTDKKKGQDYHLYIYGIYDIAVFVKNKDKEATPKLIFSKPEQE
jgi:hypothetical protein